MTYNLSLINGTGIVPLLTSVNTELMFGWYGRLALVTIFVILIMAFAIRTNNYAKSFSFASLLTALSSLLFRVIDIVSDIDVLIAWIIAAILIGVSFMSDR